MRGSADAAALPEYVRTKADLYDHLEVSLGGLIDEGMDWVSALSNAASLIYASLNRFPAWQNARINWAGFYLLSPLLPSRGPLRSHPTLLLGPFVGLPACQHIPSLPGRGVCADASAHLPPRTVRVPNTDAYPGHIACDSLSRSEIVVPLQIHRDRLQPHHRLALEAQSPLHAAAPAPTATAAAAVQQPESVSQDKAWAGRGNTDTVIIGVLDIDCEALDGFDHEDEVRLTRIAQLIVDRSAW